MKTDQKILRIALCAAGEIYGGVEEWVLTFVREVRSEKLEIRSEERGEKPSLPTSYFPLHISVLLFYDGPLAEKLRAEGVDVVVVSGSKYSLGAVRQVKAVLRDQKIDVVHTHGYRATITCAIAAKQCGLPVVKTEHSVVEPPARQKSEIGNQKSVFKKLLSDLCRLTSVVGCWKMHLNTTLDRIITRRYVDHVTYVSDFARQKIHEWYGKKSFEVIHNGIVVTPELFECPSEFSSDTFNIGIIGRLSTVKGHRFLIDAVHQLKNSEELKVKSEKASSSLITHHSSLHLHVFGSGSLEEQLRQQCRDLDLEKCVTFHGFKDQIERYVQHLDLLVMPSIFESLPYTLLEAMLYRVPIIASDVGGIPEIIDNGTDGILVPVGDTDALARAIAAVAADTKAAQARAERGYEKVLRAFSINSMVERYEECYWGFVGAPEVNG